MVEKVEAKPRERFLDREDLQVLVTAKAEDSGMANMCMCNTMPCNRPPPCNLPPPCNMPPPCNVYRPRAEKPKYE